MFAEIFAVMAPLLVCTCIGYGWVRAGQPYSTEMVTLLVTNVGAPCLILSTLTRLDIPPAALGETALIAVLAHVAFALVGFAVHRAANLPQRAFLPSQIFPNCGNMGLPVTLFAFGEPGLALGTIIFMVGAAAQATVGISIAAGATTLKSLARIPILYAVLIAVPLSVYDIALPKSVANTVEVLGGLTIPLMLITLGAALAGFKVTSLKRTLGLSALRIGGGVAVGAGLAAAFGLTGTARGVIILQSAMPVAVMNFLFAQRYGTRPEEVAGLVLVSTLMSFAALPFILGFVLS
ncbi:MAG: AEC family transporter [Alphaproteobacteria bacterium]|nr:AEC family transporter [Alphaproteobacteria bacterium]